MLNGLPTVVTEAMLCLIQSLQVNARVEIGHDLELSFSPYMSNYLFISLDAK
jgi:hypothetical protein